MINRMFLIDCLYTVWMFLVIACGVDTFVRIFAGTAPYGIAVLFMALGGFGIGSFLTRLIYQRRQKSITDEFAKCTNEMDKKIAEARKRIAPLQKKSTEHFQAFMMNASEGDFDGARNEVQEVMRINSLIDAVLCEQFNIEEEKDGRVDGP